MNKKNLLWALCIALTIAYGLIGCFDSTFYRMEIIVLALVFLVTGTLTILIIWIKKHFRKQGISIFLVLSSLCFVFLIGEHIIKRYKPNLKIFIPANYEGVVYLFPVEDDNTEVYVDDYGIGYIPHKGEFHFKVYHGSIKVADALNEGGRGTILFNGADSLHYRTFQFSCFEVVKGKTYPTTSFNQKHTACMKKPEFDSLVKLKIINVEKLFIQEWLKISN